MVRDMLLFSLPNNGKSGSGKTEFETQDHIATKAVHFKYNVIYLNS